MKFSVKTNATIQRFPIHNRRSMNLLAASKLRCAASSVPIFTAAAKQSPFVRFCFMLRCRNRQIFNAAAKCRKIVECCNLHIFVFVVVSWCLFVPP
jgi:hypothetical protein